MTTQELVEKGLEKRWNEKAFREWASQWLGQSIIRRVANWQEDGSTGDVMPPDPLEVWAFRAREMAGEQWGAACEKVRCVVMEGPFLATTDSSYLLSVAVSLRWMAESCSACYWILTGCAAIEMHNAPKS